MFESFEMAPPDAILGLAETFRKDSNPNKINLTVGVYRDADGVTPILDCVQEVERRFVEREGSKSYLAIDGIPEFCQRVRALSFGADHEIDQSQRAATIQTPGGTGALRVAADLIHRKLPTARIWCSTPTWVNHPKVFAAAGVQTANYAYIDAEGTGLDFESMCGDLAKIPAGDVVLLHGCCHNPTGIDPTLEQWQRIGDIIHERGLLPLIDFAYQGFGIGIEEDAQGMRQLCRSGTPALVCASFSKNFGLYSERVGALTVVAESPEAAEAALSHAKQCVRCNYSNPPRHGAAIVSEILGDEGLRAQWLGELSAMRDRINLMRQRFVEEMRRVAPDRDFSFIGRQRGMFSFSGLTPVQVDELRHKHSVYAVVSGGRINVAGMTEENLPRLCEAIADVL